VKGYYTTTARHYDPCYSADETLNDISFWVELAARFGGDVLEAACGTGRVLLPIARAGINIDGIDLSKEFIKIIKEKLTAESLEVQKRVTIYEGDMRDFSLAKSYDLIKIPFRPLQHLYTVEDQLKVFQMFARHLKKNGHLAFNVFYPNYQTIDELGIEKEDQSWIDPQDSSITVKRSFIKTKADKLRQFFEAEFIFRSYRGKKLVKEERSLLKMSYYTYPHLELLLKTTGFNIVEEYGSFAKEDISICKEMIIVAQKTSN
jgi:SAM-dependent methyltransferase